jgi:hypothetical protein
MFRSIREEKPLNGGKKSFSWLEDHEDSQINQESKLLGLLDFIPTSRIISAPLQNPFSTLQ